MALLTVAQAEDLIMRNCPAPIAEMVELRDATGCILIESVMADRDYPPINRATMDGIAIKAGPLFQWTIESTVAAGQAAQPLRNENDGCVRIMTGAELPPNANTVIPVEDITVETSTARLRDGIKVVAAQHVHTRGADRKKGDIILKPGTRLDATRIAILAACGHAKVKVARSPRVTVISTGNEIVAVDTKSIQPHQSRMSNLEGIRAGLEEIGIETVHALHVADESPAIRSAISAALTSSDVLIITGGMSKGQFDYVPSALEASGVTKVFHGVSQKPGKPFWFGKTDRCTVFGLPGNPVSTLTVFRRYLVPFFAKCAGAIQEEIYDSELVPQFSAHPSLTLFTPAKVMRSEIGMMKAVPVEYHGSGDLTALAESDGFVEIPAGTEDLLAPRRFSFYFWR